MRRMQPIAVLVLGLSMSVLANAQERTIAGDSRVAIDRGDIDLELASEQAVTVHVEVSRRARVTSELPGATRHSAPRWSINDGGPELKITADRGHVRLRSN